MLVIYSEWRPEHSWIITPPPDLFLSILNGWENPSTRNCEFGKESSNFVCVRTKISTYFRTSSFSWLNLLGRELMFTLSMTTLFTLLNRMFLIVDNGFKNSSLLISLQNLALIPPFATSALIPPSCSTVHN